MVYAIRLAIFSVIMVSMCLSSFALSSHLPFYLGFSYIGHRIFLHGCSSKVQPLLLTLDEVAPPGLERGIAPLVPRARTAATPWMWGCSSQLLPLTLDVG